MRVNSQAPNAKEGPYNTHSRASSSSSRAEDSGSGAEGRASKRFLKAANDNNFASRPPFNSSISSTRSITEARPNFASRRRSIRDQKVPLGPRPQDTSHSKPENSYVIGSSSKSFLPWSTSEPPLGVEQKTYAPRSSSIQTPTDAKKETTHDFLPQFSFDELHSSITLSTDTTRDDEPKFRSERPFIPSMTNVPGSTFRRSGSIRRDSVASSIKSNIAPISGRPGNMDAPNAPLAIRSRRQSHFPISGGAIDSRNPRKSIGPGVINSDFSQATTHRRRPSITPVNGNTANSFDFGSATTARGGSDNRMASDAARLAVTPRSMKTKSLQPPPRPSQAPLMAAPSIGSNYDQSAAIGTAKSFRQETPSGSGTPSTSKRSSIMPGHVSGLGARTISPTDARRLRRLSTLPPPKQIPYNPPTPQPELYSTPRSAAQSPSFIPRKSATPSSARATPDLNQKRFSSGISLSLNASFIPGRPPSGAAAPRIPQSASTSRLPNVKSSNSNSNSNSGDISDEEVPPVPAIPKAYESPNDTEHVPFFSNSRKSSLPFEPGSSSGTSAADTFPHPPFSRDELRASRDFRQLKILNAGFSSDADVKPQPVTATNKRNLLPLRLPPINLIPLNTSTAPKVAAFDNRSPDYDDESSMTPPPKRIPAKTPTTPLTASKASFFSNTRLEEDGFPFMSQLRSASSAHFLKAEHTSMRSASTSSTAMPAAIGTRYDGRQAIPSPVSTSFPKQSREFGGTPVGSEARLSKPTGPRAQNSAKGMKEDGRPASPLTEPETPSSGSEVNGRISLTGRGSPSRSSQTSKETENPPQPPKHNDMLPPRLPASTTWQGSLSGSQSPLLNPWAQPEPSMRKASAPSISFAHGRKRSDNWSINNSPKKETGIPLESREVFTRPPRTTSTILLPSQKSLATKPTINTINRSVVPESTLDRDDLAAEEEMRRIASRRKDFESAAREVDELRRRATPKEGVSPTQAIRMVNLNIFERGEIIDYKHVYFCGTQSAKKHCGDLNSSAANFGYDDDRGDYNIVTGDHLSYRYEIIDVLGKGSFGQVVRCVDHKHGGLVAIKIIRNKKRFHQQALVEVNILQKLNEWDPEHKYSMVNFTQSFYFRGHLCISTELLGMNLYEFIKSNEFRGFSLKMIRRFTKQILGCLILLKGHKVIHCDLKPENILLAHPVHSEIKVIDFGSSCFENEKVYTYIQSRFYRSPEVILGMSYGMPIDMWSVGCILAELYTGYPIFPGENEQEQLACIMEVFGPPEKHLIEKSTRRKLFFDSLGKPRLTISSKGRRRRPSSKSLQQAIKCDDEAFLDFITRCLRWDPDRRMKPDDAMHHDFITGIRNGRGRARLVTIDSPAKRIATVHSTPNATRPLPEPPATSFRNGAIVRAREGPSSSPSKPTAAAKRQSTITSIQPTSGVKRTSTGAVIGGTNLPRTTRSSSQRGDLASAAAVAAINPSRR